MTSPSILIVGRSISGLVLAASLSALGHRVILKSRKPSPSPRLQNGCTLRRAALVAIADAYHLPIEVLIERLGGATFHRFSTVRGAKTFSSLTQEVGGVSTRHDHITEVLTELLPAREHIALEEGELQLDALPDGAIVLNATGARIGPALPAAGHVSAVQLALRAPGEAALVGPGRASLVIEERQGMPQVGFLAPFHDPLTPEANAYLFYGAATRSEASIDDGWKKLLEANGITALESTRVAVQLPYSRHRALDLHVEGTRTFDVGLGFSPGAPGVALDGMTAQAVGAHAFARAFGHDGDHVAAAKRGLLAADHALAPLRKANRQNVWLHSHNGRLVRRALYRFGSNAMLDRFNREATRLGLLRDADVARTGLLTQIGRDIWRMRQVQVVSRVRFSSHMCVLRLPDGGLFVHSPVQGGAAYVRALGPVRHIVAPNLFHSAAIAEYRAAFPEAKVWVAPGLREKRPEITDGAFELDDAAPVDPAVGQFFIAGHKTHETIFLHQASKTLLITDLAYNVGDEVEGFERFWFALAGVRRTGRVPGYNRKLITDEAAFVASWKRVLANEITQASVAHGRLLRGDVKLALAQQWLPIVL